MEVKDRIIKDLYSLREYMLRHNSFSYVSENLTIMCEFNDMLHEICGLVLPDYGIALDRDTYLKRLEKINKRDLKRYYNKIVENNHFNRDTFDNYLETFYETNPVNAFKFLKNLRTFSLDESMDIVKDFFEKCDKDNIDIVSQYFDKSRIVQKYKFDEDEDITGMYRYSPLLDSGYIVLPKTRLTLFDITTLVHELSHAIERKKYLGNQMKKISLGDCLGLESPSILYEFKFMDYLLDNKIMTKDTLLLYNRLYKLTSVYARNYMLMTELEKDATLDRNGDLIVGSSDGIYYKYHLLDALCYGTDGILSMHLRELEKRDPEKFKKLFNDFMCSRKEVPYQTRIERLGFDLDEYKSCDIIKPRMLTIVNDTKKAIYK